MTPARARSFLSSNVMRRGSSPEDSARYAVKALRPDLDDMKRAAGMVDLAVERKFLSVLRHPNIVKMRGFGIGPALDPSQFLVLDRLYDTLEDRIGKWDDRRRNFAGGSGGERGVMMSLLCACLRKKDRGEGGASAADMLILDRIMVAYDIASVFRYLHGHK